MKGRPGVAAFLALLLFIAAFAMPAAEDKYQGWDCAWVVLSSISNIDDFGGLAFWLYWNAANFGTLFGWWAWRAGRRGRAALCFTLAVSSALYWPLASDWGPAVSLKIGYWAWLAGIVLLCLLSIRSWSSPSIPRS